MLPTSRVSVAAKRRDRIGSPGRSILGLASAVVLLTGMSGCMTVHNGYKALTSNGTWNDTVVVLRNRNFSAKAWHRRKHNFCNEKFNKDFCAGFRAGYEEAANGADGCTPAFPPKEYWSWEFQSAEGQGRTSAWFAGYPQGVRAAEEDGIVHWNQLPMGANLQAQYQQSGTVNHQGAVYPIPADGMMQPDFPQQAYPTPAPSNIGYPSDIPAGSELVPMPVN
ncbi:MAG: hypothetical protein R3C53_20270 [Pirellulaceae bacterium]